MAQEQNYEQSSAPSLCANNCGFFANSATHNLCSKCYRNHVMRQSQSMEMEALLSVKLTSTPSLTLPSAASAPSVCEEAPSRPSRCSAGECRKRIGLIGFKCKCGATYCATHRFPEDHSCTYDFKTAGKQALAKANPMVKAPKLHKIMEHASDTDRGV